MQLQQVVGLYDKLKRLFDDDAKMNKSHDISNDVLKSVEGKSSAQVS